MKKQISLLLALLFLCTALYACAGAETPSDNSVSTVLTTASAGETTATPGTPGTTGTASGSDGTGTTETPTPDRPTAPVGLTTPTTVTPEEPLPASYTLVGTKHLPIVDNQGGIGSCTSEGVTFTQFTVAVSQYMNYYYPEIDWNPSSGDPSVTFSAKFTYNYTTGSTSMCYRVLKDHGALPMSVSVFDKFTSYDPTKFFGGSIYDSEKTRSWEVGEGQLIDAMRCRLKNFDEVSSSGQLYTSYDTDLITRVKRAVAQGNAVAITGSSSYWQQKRLTGDGDISKKDEWAIWCSRKRTVGAGDPGGHCVAIIGYDDEAILEIGGVTMKGAFLVRNSWGNWCNEGNVWMMYDAFNTTSEYATFNIGAFNSESLLLYVAKNSVGSPSYNDSYNPLVTMTCVGESNVNGKVYPLYTLFDENTNSYLAYDSTGKTLAKRARKPSEQCYFALIPATDLDPTVTELNAYAFYAVNSATSGKYLCATGGNGASPTLSKDANRDGAFFKLNGKESSEDGTVSTAIISLVQDAAVTSYTREATCGTFGFIYWDKDIRVGLPKLIVEANVEILNRNVLYINLIRTDKNGGTMTYVPAMMAVRHDESALPDIGVSLKDVGFSGKIDVTKPESGWFAFGYDALLDLEEGCTVNDYSWGVSVNGKTLKVLELRLLDEDRNILFSVKPDKNAEGLTRDETQYFVLNDSDEQRLFVGEGSYSFINAAENKRLSLGGVVMMTFAWDNGKPNKKNVYPQNFVIRYNADIGGYLIYDYKEEFVFDISKNAPEEGGAVQLNKQSPSRKYQALTLEMDENGRVRFALKNAPEYVFGWKNGKFGVYKDDGSDTLRWYFRSAGAEDLIDLEQKGDRLLATVRTPRDAGNEALMFKIVKDGEIVDLLEFSAGESGANFSLTLDPGTYLFTVLCGGKPTGIQVARTVRSAG